MKKLIPVACSALLIGSSTNSVLAEEVSGEKIYRYHGCINCHGAQGKNPANSEVPKIGGRPADELFAATMKILAEGEKSGKSELMHATIFSSSECDAPPPEEDIRAISYWLATQ